MAVTRNMSLIKTLDDSQVGIGTLPWWIFVIKWYPLLHLVFALCSLCYYTVHPGCCLNLKGSCISQVISLVHKGCYNSRTKHGWRHDYSVICSEAVWTSTSSWISGCFESSRVPLQHGSTAWHREQNWLCLALAGLPWGGLIINWSRIGRASVDSSPLLMLVAVDIYKLYFSSSVAFSFLPTLTPHFIFSSFFLTVMFLTQI